MSPRLLLDTHVLLRWLAEPKRLSREQQQLLSAAAKRGEVVAVSDVTLLEMAVLLGQGSTRTKLTFRELFADLENNPSFRILPVTFEIAAEIASLGGTPLRDPADRAIIATARVHKLKLLTLDQRIIDSKLVLVVD